MNIKEMYHYMFYKLYKALQFASDWWTEWRAYGFLLLLEILFLISFSIYYEVFTQRFIDFNTERIYLYVSVAALSILNYFVFMSRDQWKSIVKKYSKLPKNQQLRGSWIVFGVVCFVIINLIYSFHLLSKMKT